jgi:subtilisin family serine protease
LLLGKGVTIYVLDSGINFSHNEFAGRSVRCGYSAIPREDCEDGRGHGSHVSATAAGTNFGVAKEADLVAVKVLGSDGTGTLSGVVACINFVTDEKKKYPNKPMVANMSLGGPKSTTTNRAVASAVAMNVTVVASAGNEGFNACNKSPASSDSSITIASSGFDDTQEHYSNYGACVDLFA